LELLHLKYYEAMIVRLQELTALMLVIAWISATPYGEIGNNQPHPHENYRCYSFLNRNDTVEGSDGQTIHLAKQTNQPGFQKVTGESVKTQDFEGVFLGWAWNDPCEDSIVESNRLSPL
jgi:hypothetical protein